MTRAEMEERGWDGVDVVFVTGDAYVDHPSFAMAILGRSLEAAGFRVAILSQPDWHSCTPWQCFGRPRLFFAVSAGNMDSLINHYTANRKVRNSDAYSPGGKNGLRPDRATLAYCQRAREAYPGVPVVAGGVEASLRRLAHYDYWSDRVRRSILLDAKADLVVYGMGEALVVEIAKRLASGQSVREMRDLRGVAFVLGAREAPDPDEAEETLSRTLPCLEESTSRVQEETRSPSPSRPLRPKVLLLPSYEAILEDKLAFVKATRLIHRNTNPYNAATLVQFHDRRAVVVNPPSLPLSESELDSIYALPFSRRPHPTYSEAIPAFEMIKDSVTLMRGCFGGCTFCSITAHQGRFVQSRSRSSILEELERLTNDSRFNGVVSDLGGPTANMYRMSCSSPKALEQCRRLSCLHPSLCKHMNTDHGPLLETLRAARGVPGIRKVFVASGVRTDLARHAPDYLIELSRHHVGGHLKVAPEHCHPVVLERMKKPNIDDFEAFAKAFAAASRAAGKAKQYLVPYFIASHPGSDLDAMIALALYLKKNGYRPRQVQDFIPAPFDIATCMYHTGIDPMSGEEVYVARGERERRQQRALLQYFAPENYFEVRKALEQAGRLDLIGDGPDALISSNPPREAFASRRSRRAGRRDASDRRDGAS